MLGVIGFFDAGNLAGPASHASDVSGGLIGDADDLTALVVVITEQADGDFYSGLSQ